MGEVGSEEKRKNGDEQKKTKCAERMFCLHLSSIVLSLSCHKGVGDYQERKQTTRDKVT